jgi:hypothetical protein
MGRLLIAIPVCFVLFLVVCFCILVTAMGDCEENGQVVGCDKGLLGLLMFPGSLILATGLTFLLAKWVVKRDEAAE